MSSNLKFLVYGNTLAAFVLPLVILAATDDKDEALGIVGAGVSFALHMLAAAVAQGLGELAVSRRGTGDGEPRPPVSS